LTRAPARSRGATRERPDMSAAVARNLKPVDALTDGYDDHVLMPAAVGRQFRF
jgi:hypothetical protein